jgi:hypothetical protein
MRGTNPARHPYYTPPRALQVNTNYGLARGVTVYVWRGYGGR